MLDKHATVKVFQMRTNYSPFISGQTKELIKARNSWKKVAVNHGYKSAEKIAKELGSEIKKAIIVDNTVYFNKDFREGFDRSNAWKTEKILLGINSNFSPTSVKIKNATGGFQQVTDPKTLAELFNEYFQKIVKVLRKKTEQQPVIFPASRLQLWLSKRSSLPPPFKIQEITGTDWINP